MSNYRSLNTSLKQIKNLHSPETFRQMFQGNVYLYQVYEKNTDCIADTVRYHLM